jgi:phytoene desaturase (3,4-didehydrolycopene-forming)
LEGEGVKLVKCEPNYNIWFGDGGKFELSSDLAVMKREVERWEGREGYIRYLQFLQESHRHYELSVDHVLLKNFTGLLDMLRWSFLRELFALHPFESIYSRASRYFWSERLRRVFTFGSMYMGMSPFDAPGTYSLLQYTELAEGIWYPIGGFHAVVQALVGICERLGVDIRLQTPVKQILLTADGSRATGVQLENGETLHADVVVNNSDLVYAYNNLLPKQTAYAEDLSSRPGSCSSISFYWGLSKTVPELQAHNIFLADEYKESFDSIFKRHLIPDQPSFYVNVPSRVDPSAAPEGKDSVVVLVPVGHLLPPSQATSPSKSTSGGTLPSPTQDWPAMIALARRTILSTIAARTGADLTDLIVHEQTNDPTTWRDTFNLDKGAILGLSHSFFNVLCFRPSTRARRPASIDALAAKLGLVGRVLEVLGDVFRSEHARSVQGLYMVGASAHPGTGVPIVLAGGRLVAEQILGDLGMDIPWTGKFDASVRIGTKRDEKLDKVEKPWWAETWLVAIFMLILAGIRGLFMGNKGW